MHLLVICPDTSLFSICAIAALEYVKVLSDTNDHLLISLNDTHALLLPKQQSDPLHLINSIESINPTRITILAAVNVSDLKLNRIYSLVSEEKKCTSDIPANIQLNNSFLLSMIALLKNTHNSEMKPIDYSLHLVSIKKSSAFNLNLSNIDPDDQHTINLIQEQLSIYKFPFTTDQSSSLHALLAKYIDALETQQNQLNEVTEQAAVHKTFALYV